MPEQKKELLNNTMNIFYSLSFYSPLIICMSILLFSMFTATMEKAFVFGLWIFIITFIRILILKGIGSEPGPDIPQICNTGLTQMFIKQDVSYSIYVLSFALMYFILPMIMVSKQNNVNAMNYGVLAFFVGYIALDIFIKSSLLCVPSFFSTVVLGNVFSGLFLGGIIGVLMYGTVLKNYLYINEINSNKEVCSMPSKQQFKCKLYKNGELVGSSIN
jgi:hypothetical protein